MSTTPMTLRPVGAMVSQLARAKRMTLVEVAKAIGVHRNSLADKVAGRRAFTEDEIVKLAALFGVPPGRLFEDPLELLGIGPAKPAATFLRSTFSHLGWSEATDLASLVSVGGQRQEAPFIADAA